MKKELEIFIASSSYYRKKTPKGTYSDALSNKGKLKRVIDAIKEAGFKPVPWWSDPNFKSGKTTLESLISASKKYDGGIFILNKDIKKGKKGFPNINVLIEAGMFYASKGLEKTFLIRDGKYSDLFIPSDLLGYNIPDLKDKDLKKKIKDFFINSKNTYENTFDKVSYYISNHISEQIKNRNYRNWETKGLYIGNKSARIWDKIESSNSYKINIKTLETFIKETIDRGVSNFDLGKIDNVISLGCGNGITDNKLLKIIAEKNESICYVPIDINPLLIYYTSLNIDKTIRIPFSIVDDFEVEVEHIQKIIDGKKDEIGEKNLFIMLGVTFSNLEGTELTIFNKIKKWMGKGDYFLMDISLNKSDDLDNLKEAINDKNYYELLYNSLIKKGIIGIGEKDITFKVNMIQSEKKNLYTDIQSTKIYAYQYNNHNAMISKRYEFEDIKDKIASNFDLISSKEVKSQANRKKAFFLFKNK